MDINIKGNPGTGNHYTEIKIGNVENFNPNATTVTVTHHHYGDKTGGERVKSADANTDTTPIREEILNYVSCIRPQLKDEWKSRYMEMWQGILDLDAIAQVVYDPGKQQDTNFNRALIANIIHYLGGKGIYNETYSATTMAVTLEGNKDHTVRGPLGKDPSDAIVSRLNRFFETFEAK